MLGVEPMLGRNFRPEDAAAPGLETSVILTHGLWQRRFAGDPAIIGRGMTVNERARTVVGVMPPGFKFPERGGAVHAASLGRRRRARRPQRGRHGRAQAGRLDWRRRSSECDGIAARLEAAYPESNRGYGMRVLRFRDSQVGRDDAPDQPAR